MSTTPPMKLLPRNAAAFRAGSGREARLAAGNPVSTRLESGVGNCFPGLECDVRNLDRRFFPFLEVDIIDNFIIVAAVDLNGAERSLAVGDLPEAAAETYRRLAGGGGENITWLVTRLKGHFGPMGELDLEVGALSTPSNGRPVDAWTAVRLLDEDSEVELTLRPYRRTGTLVLKGRRARYLDGNGALAAMFQAGELTQSLCSPWTHDFRDCGCFYWASNHPDIVTPVRLAAEPADPAWNRHVDWLRSERSMAAAPPPPDQGRDTNARRLLQMDHYEINHAWQSLHIVLEGREQGTPYVPRAPKAEALDPGRLEEYLRYVAGVELAVMHEYLAAAYSLRADVTGLSPGLADDIRAARSEIMRVAIGEMTHIRAVNDVLASWLGRARYQPALQVSRTLPLGGGTQVRPQAALPAAIDRFIDIERPSAGVDGLYARILATLEKHGTDEQEQMVRRIMAEGEEHQQTFEFIKVWLGRHAPVDYLVAANPPVPPDGHAGHTAVQSTYQGILELLYDGYLTGGINGAQSVNGARMAMLPPNGLAAQAQAVAAEGLLVVFDPIDDPRFVPIDAPQDAV